MCEVLFFGKVVSNKNGLVTKPLKEAESLHSDEVLTLGDGKENFLSFSLSLSRSLSLWVPAKKATPKVYGRVVGIESLKVEA